MKHQWQVIVKPITSINLLSISPSLYRDFIAGLPRHAGLIKNLDFSLIQSFETRIGGVVYQVAPTLFFIALKALILFGEERKGHPLLNLKLPIGGRLDYPHREIVRATVGIKGRFKPDPRPRLR
jgi:hypothetical protein